MKNTAEGEEAKSAGPSQSIDPAAEEFKGEASFLPNDANVKPSTNDVIPQGQRIGVNSFNFIM